MKSNGFFHAGFFLLTLSILCAACLEGSQDDQTLSRYDLIKTEKILPPADEYPPILHSSDYSQPVPVDGSLNSAGLEDAPFITPDGNTLFVFFTPDADTPANEQINDGITGIYVAEKADGAWGEPGRVLLGKGQALDGCPTMHGNTLWFCSIRKGNYRDIDIWTAEHNGTAWEKPKNAGETINEILQVGELHLSEDGRRIYYHRLSESGADYDLWVVEFSGQTWGNAKPVSAANTEFDDSRPALSPDGQELWFTRTYQGTPAIFRSVWDGADWGAPELVISQFAGEPSIDAQGNVYFTHHFFQDGKMMEADIYVAFKK